MTVHRLEAPPAIGRLYARALATAPARRGEVLPDTVYELSGLAVDRDRLAAYDAVCGFRLGDLLPPTYPHVMAFPLAMALMTDPDFPFALPGLVHIANRITQSRPIDAGERLSFRAGARDLRPHRRGRQFDVVAEAAVGDEAVWTGVSTYLKLGGEGERPAADPAAKEDPKPSGAAAVWRVPGDTGRRYASVSGDSNPIHLHPLTARLFGFRRAIAHGMWVKARCLAALEGRLPGRLIAEVEFKAPLLLPSTVEFSAKRMAGGFEFRVAAQRTARAHLEGRVREADAGHDRGAVESGDQGRGS